MERFSYLGDDNSSAGGAIIYILLNPNVHYHTHNSLPWIPTKPSRIYEGRTGSHEQLLLHANWEQQMKESAVVDGTSCCVILQCLVMSIACITWLVSLLTKWPTTICRFASVLSSNPLWKRKSLLQKLTRDFSVVMEVCAWVQAVFEDEWNIFKDEKTEAIQKAVHQRLQMAGMEFYCRGIFKLPERWQKCVQRSGDYVEK